MFGRRVPPHIVFLLSLLLAALCGWAAYVAFARGSTLWGAVAAVFAVWFVVDAVRSYSWAQNKKRLEAEKAAQTRK